MTNMIDCPVECIQQRIHVIYFVCVDMQAQAELVRLLQEERDALPLDTVMSLTHAIFEHNDGHYTAWYELYCTLQTHLGTVEDLH